MTMVVSSEKRGEGLLLRFQPSGGQKRAVSLQSFKSPRLQCQTSESLQKQPYGSNYPSRKGSKAKQNSKLLRKEGEH